MSDLALPKKTAQLERIAAVNHWRGQCLDNFARVERAVIECSLRLNKEFGASLTIEESARNRTRRLHEAIIAKWPKHADAKRAGELLEKWMIREKQRNELVHGIFLISANGESGWDLTNRLLTVKKGLVIEDKQLLTNDQAAAFLKAIVNERKLLEAALTSFAPS